MAQERGVSACLLLGVALARRRRCAMISRGTVVHWWQMNARPIALRGDSFEHQDAGRGTRKKVSNFTRFKSDFGDIIFVFSNWIFWTTTRNCFPSLPPPLASHLSYWRENDHP